MPTPLTALAVRRTRRGWRIIRASAWRLSRRPRVLALGVRYAAQISFVRARLSPGSYLGLQLTLGALVMAGAAWLFGGIAEDVVTGDPLTLVDVAVAQWFHAHATPTLTQVMLLITHLHDPLMVIAGMVLVAAYLAWKRRWYWLVCLSVCVPSGMLLNVLMKYAFQRARPSFDHPLLTLSTYSFPSGHVAAATLFYGVIAAMLAAQTTTWRRRVLVALLALAMVTTVAVTRMYLGVHYLSDVLAAFAEGLAWLALCLTGIHTYWQYRMGAVRAAAQK
jgi:undecaprenyl-diphosphatase